VASGVERKSNTQAGSWKELGIKCQTSKQYAHAVDAYLRAVEQSADDFESWFNLGHCYGELQQYQQGIKAYQRGLKLNRTTVWAWRNLAWSYRRVGDTANASLVLLNATSALPQIAALWVDLGLLYVELGEHDHAVKSARYALTVEPLNKQAWDCLGQSYQKAGKIDEAIKCFQRLTTLDRNDGAVWRRLSECYEKTGNKDGELPALVHLVRCCPADGGAWNKLGIVFWNDNELQAAAQAFSKAYAQDHNEPLYLFNAGLSFAKLGKPTDAVECFRAVLKQKPDYAKAAQQLATIESTVTAFDRYLEQLARSSASERCGDYLSPFELLNYKIESLARWDDNEVRRRKKQLLAELKLNDGRVTWIGDAVLQESSVRQVLDDLDFAERRYHHYLLYSDRDLLRFITHGNLSLFRPTLHPRYLGQSMLDVDFRDFLGPVFVQQYNRALTQAVKNGAKLAVVALMGRQLPIEDNQLDDCFAGTYQLLQQVHEQVQKRVVEAEEDATSAIAMATDGSLSRLVQTDVINALPTYFEGIRTKIAKAVRSAAITCNNTHDDIETAMTLLAFAKKLAVDRPTSEQLNEDHETLTSNLRTVTENYVDLTIGKTSLRIDRCHFCWGDTRFDIKAVTGVRWGIYKRYTNGSQTSCSYLVSACTQATAVEVECHESKFLRWGENEAESLLRFQKTVRGFLARLAPVVIERILNAVRGGGSVNIGPCNLSKAGVAFTSGALFWRKDHVVAWADIGCSTASGDIKVYSKLNPKIFSSLGLRDTWNAVLLEMIVDCMNSKD
jgi:tetratricopeptide (TPR) repeat protein